MKKAFLVLEDGTVLEGESVGAEGEALGEIVFSTGMVGYQEELTDPSFEGLLVMMTYPLIGNYGVNGEDGESDRPHVKGLVIKEAAELPNNFRSEGTIEGYLKQNNIVTIAGIDTRALTRRIRSEGTMNALITTDENFNFEARKEEIRSYRVGSVVEKLSCKESYTVGSGKYKVALLDLGVKRSVLENLTKMDYTVTVYPADTSAEDILSTKPDGIVLSNGAGDPKECGKQIETVKKLLDSGVPLFAICLGHQLAALASGFDTEKLKFGHRGASQPVKDVATDRTYVTSQNHAYVVKKDSVDPKKAEISHINVNDGTVEGLVFKDKPAFSVQFFPVAAPGQHNTKYLFERFSKLMGGNQ